MKIIHYDDHVKARAAAYPDVGDQLDALWKLFNHLYEAGEFPVPAAQAMRERLADVKARYPKKPSNVE
jgi:hypothetical protein